MRTRPARPGRIGVKGADAQSQGCGNVRTCGGEDVASHVDDDFSPPRAHAQRSMVRPVLSAPGEARGLEGRKIVAAEDCGRALPSREVARPGVPEAQRSRWREKAVVAMR